MSWIVALFTIIWVVLFLIVGIPVSLFYEIAKKISPEKAESFAYAFVRLGFAGVRLFSFVHPKVNGLLEVPEGPVLYCANHRSMFDIVTAWPLMKGKTAIIAKVELQKVPLLSYWMRQIHCIFLDRTDIQRGVQMITDATELIKAGYSVLIFPEGTRNHDEGTLLPFHAGSFKIAIRTGAPVIPVTITHTGEIFEDHFPRVWPKKVCITFGEPLPTEGIPIADRKTLPDRCKEVIEKTYKETA